MDIQAANQLKHEQQQIEPKFKKNFLLAGQLLCSASQLQNQKYNSAVFMPNSNGLVSLYAGFPTVSNKTNITTLVRFPVQYLPQKNDLVIGIVRIRTAETFVVDIGAPLDSVLGGLQFDGATKRNKPNLKVGSAVFCRVLQYSKFTGGKLSCMNKGYSGKKTNQMGQLKDGYIFWIPQYNHQIIQNNLLQKLGKCVKFEVAFGKNGRIWVNSAKLENIMLISNMFKLIANKIDEQKINTMISMIQ